MNAQAQERAARAEARLQTAHELLRDLGLIELVVAPDTDLEIRRALGYWLYQAVLDGGATSYDGYRDWLGDRNVYERTGWLTDPSSTSPRTT